MENSLIIRLRLIIDNMLSINQKAVHLISVSDLDEVQQKQAELIYKKLETSLRNFSSELNNYFRLSTESSPDEISHFTTVQLQAEETLIELSQVIKITTESSDKGQQSSSKLPKLDLPEFHGDILRWQEFWDQFTCSVHERNIANVDKLLYLKSSLKGAAKEIISGLESTNKNYQIAISTLKERYGKRSQVIDAHYSALAKISPADGTYRDCRRALSEVERHLRVLATLGEDVNHNHLRYLIMEKFPEDLIYEVKTKMKSDSTEEIRKGLGEIISAKEEAIRLTQAEEEKETSYTTGALHVREETKQDTSKRQQWGQRPWARDRRIQKDMNRNRSDDRSYKRDYERMEDDPKIRIKGEPGTPEYKRQRLNCIYCEGDHYNDQCRKFSTIAARKSVLKNRCFNCLAKGHNAGTCRVMRNCYHCNKRGIHHRSLCQEGLDKKNTTNTLHVNDSESGFTVLQTAIVKVQKGNNSLQHVKCRALLDSGSQRSYITRRTAEELGLKSEAETKLIIFTFGSKDPQEIESPVVKLKINTRNGGTATLYANIVSTITQSIPYPEKNLNHWKNKFELADDGSLSDRVDILIGNDYYFSLMSTQKIKIKENLYLVNSDLGWILSGRMDSKPSDELSVVTYFQTNLEVKLNQPDLPLNDGNLKQLWELECIGISDSPSENREEEAIRKFNETTEYVDNRYHVSWPWIEYPPPLSTNYGQARGRLINLVKRLDKITLLSYDATIKDQKEKGIIEEVPPEEIIYNNSTKHPVHYLPHHGVSQGNKPIRIVYDASSKSNNSKSLNQCLYCGPIMLEDLTGLLLKFRSHTIGICADVEKAFLQIGLQEKDRDVTRFLWLKDVNEETSEDNLIHMRFCRVPFGVISSPFLLNATIKYHLNKSNDEQMRRLTRDIYVDNLVTGVDSEREAADLYRKSKQVFQELSMNLRQWSSNSEELRKNIPDACEDSVVKVLGLMWNLNKDTLQIGDSYPNNVRIKTKREVLKVIASVYDPMGYAVPLLLPAKLFLQELWKEKIKWDTPFQQSMTERWEIIYNNLLDIKRITVPRSFFKNKKGKKCQIHCFTDASTTAYAAVVYIVNMDELTFVIGKSRLTPIKDHDNLSIPRLELLGVLIGCRLIKYALKFLQLDVTRSTLWTDSQIVIDWCKSDKILPPFVARRVEEIKKHKDLVIRYVPSEINPADVATKSNNAKKDSKRWLDGPRFLLKDPDSWPSSTPTVTSLVSGEDLPSTSSVEDIVTDDVDMIGPEEVQGDSTRDTQSFTTIQEVKRLQAEHFPQELEGKETDMKRNLGLFKDVDGVLRCRGRLGNTGWSFDKRYPILIPKDCEYTDNIIMTIHKDNYHVGANHTLSLIRQNFWIPQGKSKVMKILKRCPNCVKHGGGPFRVPPTPALPPERVNYSSPFTFTGIDYLGPVLVKTGTEIDKRWICLFTCLAVRAVHLEVVKNLTAEEGLLALRRMISSRGVPTLITSDNATNFKLISEILESTFCVEKKIHWRFIPQLAPWFGGFYERLVGIVKNCLKRTLEKHLLKDDQMNTIIKEIEAVVNTRPLTSVDSELTHILKPSDFLTMGNTILMRTTERDLPELQGSKIKVDLISSWKKGLIVLEEFKDMFINRYLLSLRERYGNALKQPRVTSNVRPVEGQIVQIKGDRKNREDWKVGKIISLPKGADNLCRIAKVKVGDKEFIRSLAQLYPLEIEEESDGEQTEPLVHKGGKGETSNSLPDIQGLPISEISTDEKLIQPALDSEMVTDLIQPITEVKSTKSSGDTGSEPKQRRGAAIKALEKIKQWTHNLLALF